jgi:hypothetical protein
MGLEPGVAALRIFLSQKSMDLVSSADLGQMTGIVGQSIDAVVVLPVGTVRQQLS